MDDLLEELASMLLAPVLLEELPPNSASCANIFPKKRGVSRRGSAGRSSVSWKERRSNGYTQKNVSRLKTLALSSRETSSCETREDMILDNFGMCDEKC